jgi:hypothetical protein
MRQTVHEYDDLIRMKPAMKNAANCALAIAVARISTGW